jgi:hypothetical protein
MAVDLLILRHFDAADDNASETPLAASTTSPEFGGATGGSATVPLNITCHT